MSAIFHVLSGIATLPSFFRNVRPCDWLYSGPVMMYTARPPSRRVAERVLELRPDALIQVGLLRHDVREIERRRVVDVAARAIGRARHVAAIESAVGVVGGEDLLVGRQDSGRR